jgi:hypothetical protein
MTFHRLPEALGMKNFKKSGTSGGGWVYTGRNLGSQNGNPWASGSLLSAGNKEVGQHGTANR